MRLTWSGRPHRVTKLFLLLLSSSTAGFAQNPRWQEPGLVPIPPRADLDVRWEASWKEPPREIAVFRILPNRFSQSVITNLMELCLFTERNLIQQDENGIAFQAPDRSTRLDISFPSANISYSTTAPHYGPTNLAQGVPPMSDVPKLAAEFLKKTGLDLNSPQKGHGAEKAPTFHVSEPGIVYFLDHTNLVDHEYRSANFGRYVEGIPFFIGDGGAISFGEHGKIRGFSITWHKLERCQSLRTVTPESAIKSIRQGKAVRGLVLREIDWAHVQRVTIKKAEVLYYAGVTDRLYPFLALTATTEPSFENLQVEIDCPVIDETKIEIQPRTR